MSSKLKALLADSSGFPPYVGWNDHLDEPDVAGYGPKGPKYLSLDGEFTAKQLHALADFLDFKEQD